MIIVSGTKRTGTSLMMQMLQSAGFNVLGEKFPEKWDGKNNVKNPEGFYESKFIDDGVTNTNCPLAAQDHIQSAVKVFCPGVPNTDSRYIHKVVLMVRDWKEQVQSWKELTEMNTGKKTLQYPDGYEYFFSYYDFIKDLNNRRYNTIVIDYNDLLKNPKNNIESLNNFFGVGRWDLAKKCIKKKLYTVNNEKEKIKTKVDPEFGTVLDKLYEELRTGKITEGMLGLLEAWYSKLAPEVLKINEKRPKKKK